MNENVDKTLLLAPNYVKDVAVQFGGLFQSEGGQQRRKLTITLEIDDKEANIMLGIPGMDEFQFVSFLTPCIQTSILKTIQGHGKNNVKIEEMKEPPSGKSDNEDDELAWL